MLIMKAAFSAGQSEKCNNNDDDDNNNYCYMMSTKLIKVLWMAVTFH
jgi:hypothetical protein